MTQTGEQLPRAPLLQPPPRHPSAYERFVRLGVFAWAGIGVIVLAYLLISPNVMSRTVQLHPVVVMLALLVGASITGLFGMLVIVPLVAVAKIVFLYLWSQHVDYGDDLVGGAPG